MMTVREAITHAFEVADRLGCTECAANHRQIAGWLQELLRLRGQIEKLRRENAMKMAKQDNSPHQREPQCCGDCQHYHPCAGQRCGQQPCRPANYPLYPTDGAICAWFRRIKN